MNISCIVDVASREVSFQENYRIAAYDHNVDVIHFSVEPIEDFSLDTSSIKIAAQGPNKARHDYAVDPSTVAIEEETGYITFDWPIPAGVTEMPIGTFKYGDKGQLIFAVCAEIISGDTVSKAWHSDDGIITVVAHLEPEAGGGEDPEEEATNAQKIGQLQTDVAVINTQVGALANGSPTPVATVAEMTDESAVYLYTGSETGYTAGNWYYWSGSAWTSGGTYGGAVTDTTLSISGAAADAKAVGDALAGKADDTDVTALDTRVTALEEGESGGWVKGIGIETLISLTQSEYDAIQTKDPATLYIITDEGGGGGLPSYRVTNALTHITTTNSTTSVLYGNTYSATLIPDENYFIDSVSITMGGVNITNSVYNNGVISIPSVTGNIVITAVGDTSLVSLPYLESDGSAYVVTDFVPDKTGLVYEAKLKNINTSDGQYYFGAFKFQSEQLGARGYGSGWVNVVHDGVNADFKIGATNVAHTLKRTPTALYCDDFDTPVKTVSAGSAISTNPFSVFAKHDGTGVAAYRLYYIKIYDTDGTTLLHEYVPAEHNGAACLYDSVTSKYFYNAGTGTLTYGTELMS